MISLSFNNRESFELDKFVEKDMGLDIFNS